MHLLLYPKSEGFEGHFGIHVRVVGSANNNPEQFNTHDGEVKSGLKKVWTGSWGHLETHLWVVESA